jgi:sugar (pentulose or hexulose) kinase
MSLLGIDIGSSSCKGVVFNADGKELARELRSYSTLNPGPSMVEMDAVIFRDTVFDIIRLLNGLVINDPVEALAISSHGETTIPVDKNGNATGPAIMNADNRAVEESDWWDKTFGKEALYKICMPERTDFLALVIICLPSWDCLLTQIIHSPPEPWLLILILIPGRKIFSVIVEYQRIS